MGLLLDATGKSTLMETNHQINDAVDARDEYPRLHAEEMDDMRHAHHRSVLLSWFENELSRLLDTQQRAFMQSLAAKKR